MKSLRASTLIPAAVVFFSGTAFAADAKLVDVQGRVQARANASRSWEDARAEMPVSPGVQILTGADGRCDVGFFKNQKSVIRLNPNTHAVVATLDPPHIDVSSGKILALVRGLKRNSSFEVSTPTAVAAVRGTGWSQTAEEVGVFEGSVHVAGVSSGRKDVTAGNGIRISAEGAAGETFPLGDAAKSEWSGFQGEAKKELASEEAPDIDRIEADDLDALFETKDELRDIQRGIDDKKRDKNENALTGSGLLQ